MSRIKTITDNYNKRAAEYDSMSREALPWLYFDKPFLNKHVVPVLNQKTQLLEIGSGAGKVLRLFKNKIPDKQSFLTQHLKLETSRRLYYPKTSLMWRFQFVRLNT